MFMCFVWISEQTAIISPYSINICNRDGVCLLRVRAACLYTILANRNTIPPIAVPFHQSQCHSTDRSAIPPTAVPFHQSQCHSTNRSAICQSQCHSTNRSANPPIAVPFHQSQCHSTNPSAISPFAVLFHQSQSHSANRSAIPATLRTDLHLQVSLTRRTKREVCGTSTSNLVE